MNLVQSFLTKNPCFAAGKTITVKGLMLHSVGCSQPNAQVFIKNWNKASYDKACVHGFIDGNDGTIYQTLPWEHRGWHAGGAANNTHIGIEMCEPACIKYNGGSSFTCSDTATAKAVVKRTYEVAVELFAMLCKEYDLNPLTDIISHKEGHANGIASDHGDPEHLWKGLKTGYTMDTFRQAVQKKMNESALSPAEKDTSFMVRVNIPNLNIRKGPGKNYACTGTFTGIGVFTIVEVKPGTGSKSGWGKLKSGIGWIALDYAIKI